MAVQNALSIYIPHIYIYPANSCISRALCTRQRWTRTGYRALIDSKTTLTLGCAYCALYVPRTVQFYWAPFSHVHIARDMRVVYTACRLCAICKAQLALISQHLHMPPVNDKRGAYCAQYVLIMHTAHIARNGQTVHIARNVKICILSAYRAQYAPFSVPCYAVWTCFCPEAL